MHSIMFRRFLTCVASLAVLGSLGCGSSPAERAAAAAESMSTFNLEIAKGNDDIDAALKALEFLVKGPGDGVKDRFDAYSKSVTALDERAKSVRGKAETMKAQGDTYFAEWEAGSSKMSPEREAELHKAYAEIETEMTAAGEAFRPFLASLKDIQSYLTQDLTAKGLEGVAPLAEKAVTNGADVKKRLDAVMKQVSSVQGMLSAKLEQS